jgi:hypothetical protein
MLLYYVIREGKENQDKFRKKDKRASQECQEYAVHKVLQDETALMEQRANLAGQASAATDYPD